MHHQAKLKGTYYNLYIDSHHSQYLYVDLVTLYAFARVGHLSFDLWYSTPHRPLRMREKERQC